MVRKRSRIDIIADILTVVRDKGGSIKPTHLMYKANLSHRQMMLYLDELFTHKLLERSDGSELSGSPRGLGSSSSRRKKRPQELIVITDKGVQFLNKLEEIRSFEEAFGL